MKSQISNKSISIVIPIYNELENLKLLNEKLLKVVSNFKNYEIIYVDDGSEDKSNELISSFCGNDKKIKLITLSRNFGHQNAICAGLNFVKNEICILMDGDLQDPPEMILILAEKIINGYDVAYAIRKNRKENFLKKFSYYFFYRLLNFLSDTKINIDSGDFSAITKKVVDIINSMHEKNKFLRGLRSWVGFKQIGVEYSRNQRFKGKTKYSFGKLLNLAYDGIISFSKLPLSIATMFGFITILLCIVFLIYTIYQKFFYDTTPQGWSSLMIAILFLGGIQLLVLGFIGQYIGRIYDDVKKRPTYIIENKKNL